MSGEFTAELRQFIAQHVESVAQLEALLILRQDAQRRWRAEELAQRLYIKPDMGEALLADLVRRGFAVRHAEEPTYQYDSRDAAADQLVAELDALYHRRRVAVITEIYSKPVNKVQTFADAFRLRRDEP
jgi:hypothetical protein